MSIDDWPEGDELDALVAAAHRRYSDTRPESRALDTRARRVMPGGNTRSVLHFDPFPFRVATAEGPELIDVDRHRYVDFCGNYTAGLLGHSPDAVRDAIVSALDGGWALGATHARESAVAELVCERFPSVDLVRFTNSGTEANLMAIGAAIHHTGRTGVGVFDRAYHGGVLSFDHRGRPGPLNVPHRWVSARFGDVESLDALFADVDLACVLVEAVQGSGGCRAAGADFLRDLRTRCDEHGVVLVFDEVMTSRLSSGGAQELFGVLPDLTTLGKYLGGGMTFGAFGGRREIMAAFDPAEGGELTQAGTFNNNVVSMSAALATLRSELDPARLAEVNARGERLRHGLADLFRRTGSPLDCIGVGSMVCLHATDERVLALLFHHLLRDSIYVSRRGFMALSTEITDTHVDALIDSVADFVSGCGRGAADSVA